MYLKKVGILPAGATVIDLRIHEQSSPRGVAHGPTSDQYRNEDEFGTKDSLGAKREALLASIASGGIDVSPTAEPQAAPEPSKKIQQDAKVSKGTVEKRAGDDNRISDLTVPPAKSSLETLVDALRSENRRDNVTSGSDGIQKTVSAQCSAAPGSPNPPSQQSRSKLNLSGAKRMLFGSLGLKTPKSKEDESKTREKLMQDIRPLRDPQANGQADNALNLAEIAADDSWKEKIDLRAVECCHAGIQLSTPPFPFVQRWDPQQRRGYDNDHARKRKGKKRKRNNDNYYEDSSYQDSQIEGPPSHSYTATEDRSQLPVEENGMEAHEEHRSLDVVMQDVDMLDAPNEQLSRETQHISPGTLANSSGTAEDLPKLPEDPTTCPTLTREAARKGTIIAFKQLEMSAETNWQPNISNYRTAIVDEITEKGSLQMTPAKRDRPTRQMEYDSRTGERLYAKFEMPGYNDGDTDQDEPDKLEISFNELINPLLIRAADDSHAQTNGEQHEASKLSTKSPAPAEASASVTRGKGQLQHAQSDINLNAEPEQDEEKMAQEPSKETREEISELIRDAGWHSSVQSGVTGALHPKHVSDGADQEDDHEDTTLINAPSPRFNGFSSSPVVNVRSSPPLAETRSPKRLHASGTEIADSVPPQDIDGIDIKSETRDARFGVAYPSLPQLEDDSELLQVEAQQRSDPPFDQQTMSQDLISNGLDQPPAQSTRSQIRLSQDHSSPKQVMSFDGQESEDEFPAPFSQAWNNRLSQDVEIKQQSSQEKMILPPSYRRSRNNARTISSQRESNRTWKPEDDWSGMEDDEDDGTSTPRPSQQQMSSQVVDLTMSSDSIGPHDSSYHDDADEDSYKLPKGPGWVKKTKASRERSVSLKPNSGKTKTKSR